MQENKLISTIDSLNSLGQREAIISLASSLQRALDHARDVLKINKPESTKSELILNESIVKLSDERKYSEYNKNWANYKKILYILKEENRFLRFRQIAKLVVSIEKSGDETEITRALTNAARELKQTKKIVSVVHGNSKKNTFWGSPKWLEETGEVKKEHFYVMDTKKIETFDIDEDQKKLFEI